MLNTKHCIDRVRIGWKKDGSVFPIAIDTSVKNRILCLDPTAICELALQWITISLWIPVYMANSETVGRDL